VPAPSSGWGRHRPGRSPTLALQPQHGARANRGRQQPVLGPVASPHLDELVAGFPPGFPALRSNAASARFYLCRSAGGRSACLGQLAIAVDVTLDHHQLALRFSKMRRTPANCCSGLQTEGPFINSGHSSGPASTTRIALPLTRSNAVTGKLPPIAGLRGGEAARHLRLAQAVEARRGGKPSFGWEPPALAQGRRPAQRRWADGWPSCPDQGPAPPSTVAQKERSATDAATGPRTAAGSGRFEQSSLDVRFRRAGGLNALLTEPGRVPFRCDFLLHLGKYDSWPVIPAIQASGRAPGGCSLPSSRRPCRARPGRPLDPPRLNQPSLRGGHRPHEAHERGEDRGPGRQLAAAA